MSKHKLTECDHTESNISKHDIVFQILRKNPLEKPTTIALILERCFGIVEKKPYNYIRKLKVEFKKAVQQSNILGLGSGCRNGKSTHKVRVDGWVPKSIDRGLAVEVGWRLSRNRNKTLIWRDSVRGRIEWFTSGYLLATIRKPQTMAQAYTLISKAFYETGLIYSNSVLKEFLNTIQWYGQHDTFETGIRLPYKVISEYEEPLGLRIKLGDASDPTKVEVERHRPNFIDTVMDVLQSTAKALEQNAEATRKAIAQNTEVIRLDSQSIGQNSEQLRNLREFLKDLSQPKKLDGFDKKMVV